MAIRKKTGVSRTASTTARTVKVARRTAATPVAETEAAEVETAAAGSARPQALARAVTPTRLREPLTPLKPNWPGGIRPPLLQFDHVGNLFDSGRPGDAVVRPEDLLALRIEMRNLEITKTDPPRLKRAGSGAAYLILHFPPQAITEETFYEQQPPEVENPENPFDNDAREDVDPDGTGSDTLKPPPVRARIAGESRLVFKVPTDFDVPYSLSDILDVCQDMAMNTAANARAGSKRPPAVKLGKLFDKAVLKKLTPAERARLSEYAVSNLRLASRNDDVATVRMRQYSGQPALRAVPDSAVIKVPDLRRVRKPPKPGQPSSIQTAIEMPWRLVVSPHAGEAWRHALAPITSAQTGHTELWHSRLVAPDGDGQFIETSYPDRSRTLRAIWALSGEGSQMPMQGQWPNSPNTDLPQPDSRPFAPLFRMPLDDYDRYQIAHLSSNFSLPGYAPLPVSADTLMLSALGGWLESRGAWDPPGLSVEEWGHRASMARDHYVRVVYKGFLFPFGHRVSLVKVTERKFHNGKATSETASGNTAYLRQRLFLVVRERERRFDLARYADLRDPGDTRYFLRQLPFSRVRLLTQVTPDLDRPDLNPSAVDVEGNKNQKMFWPHVAGSAFSFQCVGTDLDGRQVAFKLPMIFIENTLACPRDNQNKPKYAEAEKYARIARDDYQAKQAGGQYLRDIDLSGQKVALAASLKAGDTSVQVSEIRFGAEVSETSPVNQHLRNASDDLARPVYFPRIDKVQAQLPAVAHLTGSGKGNELTWNAHYLEEGFDNNQSGVFVDVGGSGQLDFSAQGDRSGGFVQPNLAPSALSRLAGPVMGEAADYISGNLPQGGGFPGLNDVTDLPLPLLFGCIPLSDLIQAVSNLSGNTDLVPKFVSEAGTQLETFVGALVRVHGLVSRLASQPAEVARASLQVFSNTLDDILKQAEAHAQGQIGQLKPRINDLLSKLQIVVTRVQALIGKTVDSANLNASITALGSAVADARQALMALQTEAASVLPAGLRQSVQALCLQLGRLLDDLDKIGLLVQKGLALFHALEAIVGQPEQITDLFTDAGTLGPLVQAVADAIDPLRTVLASIRLIDGAVRRILLSALDAVGEVAGTAQALAKLLEGLTGDELNIRFDWNPEIDSWWLPGTNPNSDDPIFRANDKRGFIVAVDARVKKDGLSSPKIGVVCSLKHFDLVLIAPASFLELNFEKIEFVVDSSAKMDVDVLLTDIKFVGPLSFVETLRDLIPLDGFSDPPFLDITPQGLDAGFSVALPAVTVGVLNLSNLSLGAGFTVPFIGQPLSVRFNFCTREQPFLLTVYMFGGGGFFGVTVDPHGVQVLEAAFEFGASLSVDFGVASGGVEVMAGIYFRMEQTEASLTGYFRLGGHVNVLGLISASIELYLELLYEFESGKCTGRAQLTIEISVFLFSASVTISCERKFAGSNGDPSLRQMLGYKPQLTLQQELSQIDENTQYAWREYCESFA